MMLLTENFAFYFSLSLIPLTFCCVRVFLDFKNLVCVLAKEL